MAARAILHGHYQRSRSFGFPLHEAATSLLYWLGGVTAANLGSAAITLCGILLAVRIAERLAPDRAVLAAWVLCLSPLLLADGSATIDFGWSFASGMAIVLAALRLEDRVSPVRLATFGASVTASILLRPDNGLFAAAVTLALLVQPRQRAKIAVTAVLAALCALAIYVGLNGADMFATAVSTTRPWPARLMRAGVFLLAALGPGGFLALAGLAWLRPRGLLPRMLLCAWALYLPRFVALPDQLDYLILPVELTALAGAILLPWRAALASSAAFCLPALVSLSLLERDGQSGAVRGHIALMPGAFEQEVTARRFIARMETPEMTARVLHAWPGPGAPASIAPASIAYDEFMPGYVSPNRDLVLGEAHLYRVLPRGGGAGALNTVPRSRYRTIWACNQALGPGIGWRGLEPPTPLPTDPLLCRRAQG